MFWLILIHCVKINTLHETLALCLGLQTSLCTEDNDFFGLGITTWKSALIDIFLT